MLYRALSADGSLILPPEATIYLRRFDGEPIIAQLEPVYSRRTVPQNRRLFAGYGRILRHFASQLPYPKEELHEALKSSSEVVKPAMLYFPNGKPIGQCWPTKTLPVPTFSDYMEETTARFAGVGLELYPEPWA